MKNLKMFGLCAFLALFSCTDDDANTYVPNVSIVHEWTLTKSTGTIAGITHDFPSGTILWKFMANNTVTVTNNNTNNNLQSGFPSGTYTYSISNNTTGATCEKKITINANEEFNCLQINDTEMNIDQGVADGINYHFERVMPFTTN